METREDLEKKVDRLEKEVALLRLGPIGSVRKRSEWCMGEIPLYEIALGPDPKHGEMRGHAKAIIAIQQSASTTFEPRPGW